MQKARSHNSFQSAEEKAMQLTEGADQRALLTAGTSRAKALKTPKTPPAAQRQDKYHVGDCTDPAVMTCVYV